MASVETLEVFERTLFFEHLEREHFRKWIWEQLIKEQLEKAEAVEFEYQFYRRRKALEEARRGRVLHRAEEQKAALEEMQKLEGAKLSSLLEACRRLRRPRRPEERKEAVPARKEESEAKSIFSLIAGKKRALEKYSEE